MRRLLAVMAMLISVSASAQTGVVDSACFKPLAAAVDSLGKLHLSSTIPTRYQTRAVATLTAAHVQWCTRPAPPVEDTTPPPPPPPPPPAPKPTLTLTPTDTILRVRPLTPFTVFITAAGDSAGTLTTDYPTFSVSDTTLAAVYWLNGQRKLQVSNATKAGRLVITARWGSATASTAIRVEVGTAPPPPPPPPTDTTTLPPPPPPPPPPAGITNPELPRVVAAYPLALHTRPCTQRVTTSAALQQALNLTGAQVICLPMGATFPGTFDIPKRAAGDTAWRVLRADSTFTLGQRLTGAERLPRLVVGTDLRFPSIWIHASASRWLVQGVEFTADATISDLTPGKNRLALIEIGERNGNTAANLPSELHFAHVNVHGHPLQQNKVGVYLNVAGVTFRDGRCTEIHTVNSDNQCLLAINAPGPFLFENSLLEAASENIMFGGGDPSIPGLVPCDATIRGNTISKPIAWKSVGTPTLPGSYLVKLLIEAKSACRVLVENNRLDGVWLDGQTGYAIGLKSVNQNGGCRWCRVTDWTIRNNTIVNVGAGFGFSGRPEQFRTDPKNPGYPVDTALSRVLVQGNWIDSLGIAPYNGDDRGVLVSVQANDIQFVGNTWATGRYDREFMIFDLTGAKPAVTGFRFENNVAPIAQYGVGATAAGEGSRALAAAVQGVAAFSNNVFIGAPRNGYPATTRWASSLAAALAMGAGTPNRPVP